MKPQQTNITIYILNLIVLVLSLTLLIWLRGKFAQEMESTVASIKSHFSMEEILKSPDDIQISFTRISAIVNNNRRNPFIKDLFVSKVIRGKGEHLIYPFYYQVLHPNWKNELATKHWQCEPLSSNGLIYGYLYIDLNKSPLRSVTISAISIALLIIFSLFLLMTRLRAQEIVISKTTVELKEKQRELIHLERLALVGRLTANIFHDIKKPILNIKHEVSDAEESANLPYQSSNLLKNIKDQINLYLSIIRDLNIERFVRSSDDGEGEFSNVNDLLERSLNLVRYEQGNVQITRDYTTNLDPIFAHPHQIIQVFSNIILNAYQAMQGTGTLTLKTFSENSKIIILIQDSGPGFSRESLDKLFQPFFTTKGKNEGSGLGLYISQNIIRQLSGEISVDSKESVGTIFKIIIPASITPHNNLTKEDNNT